MTCHTVAQVAHLTLPNPSNKDALLHKLPHLLQPPQILLLLLHINILRNEHGQLGINAPLVQVVLQQRLQLFVELRELRAGVELLARGRRVGDLGFGDVGAGQVGDGLDAEFAAVGHEVDAQGAFVGARDEDVDVGGEGGLGVVLSLDVSRLYHDEVQAVRQGSPPDQPCPLYRQAPRCPPAQP